MTREQKIQELKERIKERIKERQEQRKKKPPSPAPRYDDVYWRGVEWLNGL
jgi:TPP-dependent pyruvate/acetoin dehydrogenase alpha subunit